MYGFPPSSFALRATEGQVAGMTRGKDGNDRREDRNSRDKCRERPARNHYDCISGKESNPYEVASTRVWVPPPLRFGGQACLDRWAWWESNPPHTIVRSYEFEFLLRIKLRRTSVLKYNAGRGSRTLMKSPPHEFESCASANSAIPA